MFSVVVADYGKTSKVMSYGVSFIVRLLEKDIILLSFLFAIHGFLREGVFSLTPSANFS